MSTIETRRLFLACLSAATALGLAVAAPGAATAETTLTVATVDAAGTLRNIAGNRLRDNLAESDAGVTVRHIEGPVLGNAAQVRDQVAEGSVDIIGTDAAWATPYSNFLKATSYAFVFRDGEHLASVFESDFMKGLSDQIAAEQGVRILGAAALPSRAFFTKIQPQSAEDFSGLKIRSPQLDNWLASYKALGANPTPVNWNEVFLALQTGLVDGGHGLPVDGKPNNWHMAAPNITDLEDMFAVHVWMMNEARWQSLSDEEKAALQEAIDEVDTWMSENAGEQNIAAIAEMLEAGGGVYISHSADKRAAVAAMAGEDKVAEFPESEREKLRDMALQSARDMEGGAEWWDAGVLDQVQSVE
jgi:TRAP-type C4-dicarboxylate transport system substrate-binding protein